MIPMYMKTFERNCSSACCRLPGEAESVRQYGMAERRLTWIRPAVRAETRVEEGGEEGDGEHADA